MPLSTYSHHTDEKTGKVTVLPQLYPHATSTGPHSDEEIRRWVDAGIIPQELYQEHLEAQSRQAELSDLVQKNMDRLRQGEKIGCDIPFLPPSPLFDFLTKNKARIYGEGVLNHIFQSLSPNDPPVVRLSLVKESIDTLSSEDPQPVHFKTARRVLKKAFEIEETSAVDILARKLVEHCKKLKKLRTLNHELFDKVTLEPDDIRTSLCDERSKILSLDKDFIDYIKGTGSEGKRIAQQTAKDSKAAYARFKESDNGCEEASVLWSLWIPQEQDEGISLFLRFLAKAIWLDELAPLWNRQSNQSPAVAKPIIETIKPLLNPSEKKNVISEGDNTIWVNEQGAPLIMAPAMDRNLIALLQKGVKDLSSLTGHRLLRWQIRSAFEKWVSGSQDFRVIQIEGGYSQIAKQLGCSAPRDIAKVKAILHAQAYGQFVFHDGTRGNMISIRVLERHKNSEPSKISIVLGDMLAPGYIFNVDKKNRRLIPIGELPPLHGSTNTHAQQAHLQLLVLEEFSNQSDTLATQGSVLIPWEKWTQMAHESGLNPNKIKSVVEHWCQPDLLNSFLEKQGCEYRLVSHYEDAQKFLIHQGRQRIKNSKRGQASVISKRRSAQSKSKDTKTSD